MKIIFLDIDGVLCTHRVNDAFDSFGLMEVLDPVGLRFLEKMVKDYDTKIVISSTWRIGKTKYEFITMFSVAGYPVLARAIHSDWATKDFAQLRGHEIEEWLSRHDDVDNYVILDDNSDMLDYQLPNFVKTHMYDGITYENMKRINEIFEATTQDSV